MSVVGIEAALGRSGRLLMGTPSLHELFAAMLLLAATSTIILYVLRRSRLGAGLLAVREDETAAEAIGVNTARTKLVVFGLSAIIPGMVGALMSLRFTYFEPMQSFSPVTSFTIVTIAVLGGSDDVPGPVLGAAFLVALSELLLGAGARTLHDYSGRALGRIRAVRAGRHLWKIAVVEPERDAMDPPAPDRCWQVLWRGFRGPQFQLRTSKKARSSALMGRQRCGQDHGIQPDRRHPARHHRPNLVLPAAASIGSLPIRSAVLASARTFQIVRPVFRPDRSGTISSSRGPARP